QRVSAINIGSFSGSGEHDNPQSFKGGMRADPVQHIETGELGHTEIQQHQIRQWIFCTIAELAHALEVLNSLFSVSGNLQGVEHIGLEQGVFGQLDIVFAIIGGQNHRLEDHIRWLHAKTLEHGEGEFKNLGPRKVLAPTIDRESEIEPEDL